MKKRVIGFGGVFFKASDPKKLESWYDKHLGVSPLENSPWGEDDETAVFEWREVDNPAQKHYTTFGVFPDDTDYFQPSESAFMFNFLVSDLDSLIDVLANEGIDIIGGIHDLPFGRFARIRDPEGNIIELCEPNDTYFEPYN